MMVLKVYAQDDNEWIVDNIGMYTYEDMKRDIIHVSQMYDENVIRIDSLGTTFDQREVYHIVMGNIEASEQILIIGAIHGREYITTQLVMKQLQDMCVHYNDFSGALQQVAIHFVPMSNPDGVTLSQLGLDGMNHRSTRQMIYQIYQNDGAVELKDYLQQWKANARGVDINRNFDALWEEYQSGPKIPSSDCYKGTAPHSEIESSALVNLTEKYPFVATISYHTQGQVIYWYFGQEGYCLSKSEELAELVSNITGYSTFANFKALDPAGYKDWAIQKKNIPSLTIEVGTGSSPVNPEQFYDIWEKNKSVISQIIKLVCKH